MTPRFLGQPFSGWSLSKLRDYLIETGRVETISIETARRILHERGITWQTSKTWKASNDPDFTGKMRAILDLYDHPSAGGRVVCVDEFGPLNLQPRPGKAWKPHGRPVRLRATYHRDHGVRHMIASLDLATGKIHYRIRNRKRSGEFLDFLKSLRRRWPGQRLHVILDNFSPHKHPTVRAWRRCATARLPSCPPGDSESWLFKGRKLTAFTDVEEEQVGLAANAPWLLEERLRAAGADYTSGPAWQPYVVVDGNLITGQNPASGEAAAEALLKALANR